MGVIVRCVCMVRFYDTCFLLYWATLSTENLNISWFCNCNFYNTHAFAHQLTENLLFYRSSRSFGHLNFFYKVTSSKKGTVTITTKHKDILFIFFVHQNLYIVYNTNILWYVRIRTPGMCCWRKESKQGGVIDASWHKT